MGLCNQMTPKDQLHPDFDGITHLNHYSKAKTSIGRWLSHFTKAPITIRACERINVGDHGYFASIEGYWFWLSNHHPSLRHMHGSHAREFGKSLPVEHDLSPSERMTHILYANSIKLISHDIQRQQFASTQLPFEHYWCSHKSNGDVHITTFEDRTESYFFELVRDKLKREDLALNDYVELIKKVIIDQYHSSRPTEESQYCLF